MKCRALALAFGIAPLAFGCASPPRPTPAARQLAGNPRAVVEGRVVNRAGRPVAGLAVTAIPRGRDIVWSPAATTGPDGSFSLTLFAPAGYAFFLTRDGRTVITPDADDPVRVVVVLQPGDRRTDVTLYFLDDEWTGEGEGP